MSDTSLHPYNPYKNEGTPPFDGFLPFVQVEEDSVRAPFIDVLEKLYIVTGETWKPTNCYSSTFLYASAVKLKESGSIEVSEVRAVNWKMAHYFITVSLPELADDLVVDPYGVPTADFRMWRHITPFFGQVELAPRTHREKYTDTSPGHRSFRP